FSEPRRWLPWSARFRTAPDLACRGTGPFASTTTRRNGSPPTRTRLLGTPRIGGGPRLGGKPPGAEPGAWRSRQPWSSVATAPFIRRWRRGEAAPHSTLAHAANGPKSGRTTTRAARTNGRARG